MRIRILGGGWYGAHLTSALLRDGHDVELHEITGTIFGGASGSIPARCHLGFHYPRSRVTRNACRDHQADFMAEYGHLTRSVPVNLYAIAAGDSLIDFEQYLWTLRGEVDFVQVHDPREFGLDECEGAILTGERHIVTDLAREHFLKTLDGHIRYGVEPGVMDCRSWDWTIDCTFGAASAAGVDRYEPCLVLLLKGDASKAVTIMDGPFGSLYPWDEARGLVSLSSARWTPFSKTCRTWKEANDLLQGLRPEDIHEQGTAMIAAMARFYPAVLSYPVERELLSIRAMPRSGADTRLVEVAQDGERLLRVRAGKIDAVIQAERAIKGMIEQ